MGSVGTSSQSAAIKALASEVMVSFLAKGSGPTDKPGVVC